MQGRISQGPSGPLAGQAGPRGLRQGDRREGESGKDGRMDELVACLSHLFSACHVQRAGKVCPNASCGQR